MRLCVVSSIAGLRDRQARDLANSVITSMTEIGSRLCLFRIDCKDFEQSNTFLIQIRLLTGKVSDFLELAIIILFYRSTKGIRGFSRETLSALIVEIESHGWCREFNNLNKIPPDPRASTTVDVECFLAY